MSPIAFERPEACFRTRWAGKRRWWTFTTALRRDKSPCPDRAKPLTWLALFRAYGSVAGMLPGFHEGLQASRMHAPFLAPPRGLP